MSSLARIPKEFSCIVQAALEQGVIRLEQGKRHLCAVRADGAKQMIPGSPSDHRALANFKKQFGKFVAGEPNRRDLQREAQRPMAKNTAHRYS